MFPFRSRFPTHRRASAVPPRRFLTSRNLHASRLIRKQLQFVSIPFAMHCPDEVTGVLLRWLRRVVRSAGMCSVREERPPAEFVCFVICFGRRDDDMHGVAKLKQFYLAVKLVASQ